MEKIKSLLISALSCALVACAGGGSQTAALQCPYLGAYGNDCASGGVSAPPPFAVGAPFTYADFSGKTLYQTEVVLTHILTHYRLDLNYFAYVFSADGTMHITNSVKSGQPILDRTTTYTWAVVNSNLVITHQEKSYKTILQQRDAVDKSFVVDIESPDGSVSAQNANRRLFYDPVTALTQAQSYVESQSVRRADAYLSLLAINMEEQERAQISSFLIRKDALAPSIRF